MYFSEVPAKYSLCHLVKFLDRLSLLQLARGILQLLSLKTSSKGVLDGTSPSLSISL